MNALHEDPSSISEPLLDKVEIDLNQLVPGMYIIQIVDKQNLHIMFDKLVKI